MTDWTLVAVEESRAADLAEALTTAPDLFLVRDPGLDELNAALVHALGGPTALVQAPPGWEHDPAFADATATASAVLDDLAGDHGHAVVLVSPYELLPFWSRVRPRAARAVAAAPPGDDVRDWAARLLGLAVRHPFPALFDPDLPEAAVRAIRAAHADTGGLDAAQAMWTALTALPPGVTGPLAALLLEGVSPPGDVEESPASPGLRDLDPGAVLVVVDGPPTDDAVVRAIRGIVAGSQEVVTTWLDGAASAVPTLPGHLLDPGSLPGLRPAAIARVLQPAAVVFLGDVPRETIADVATACPAAATLACPTTRLPVGHRPIDAVTDLRHVAQAVADRVGRWAGPIPAPPRVPLGTVAVASRWDRVRGEGHHLGTAVAATRAADLVIEGAGTSAPDDAIERAVALLGEAPDCGAVAITTAPPAASWPADATVRGALVVRRRDLAAIGGVRDLPGPAWPQVHDLLVRLRRAGRTIRAIGGATDDATIDHWGEAAVRRRLGTPADPGGVLAAGLVLADGDPAGARDTAHSLLAVVDHVRILERGDVLHTEAVATEERVDVVAWDWQAGAADVLATIGARWVVVAGAGERLSTSTIADARRELEAIPHVPHAIQVGTTRSEARVVPADATFEHVIGTTVAQRLRHVSLAEAGVSAP